MDYPVLTPAQLAAHLRSLRKAQNLTQAQLGAKVALSQARIGKIERDPRQVSIGQLMHILALLGVRLILQTPASEKSSNPSRHEDASDW
jgi:HTH-type transcriptional regulator / antitoxin HipB